MPESGTTISKYLNAGDVLYLSGGQFRYGGRQCGEPLLNEHACVLLVGATREIDVVVEGLIEAQNFVDVRPGDSREEMLARYLEKLWAPSNCVDGCERVTVLYFVGDQFERQEKLTRP